MLLVKTVPPAHLDLNKTSTTGYSYCFRFAGFLKSLTNRSLLDASRRDRGDCCLLLRCVFLLPFLWSSLCSNRRRTDCQEHPSQGWDGEDEGHQDPPHDRQVRRRGRLYRDRGPGKPAPGPDPADAFAAGDD